ncbi:MAG: sulfur carrier protein ThiS adenylyltransferase ThiF [Chitinivibrionales bacterium]|nr:sulfur carrier protein ThiS adenylyltransferase ThiF [Chitinivibrionales bacterium]MBD3355788.1 sulfur carrier protein ThiS adenylyltransferase ThiF [Chitinivibrionales bacterium]
MKILVNEQSVEIEEGVTADELRNRIKQNADIIIVDGAPARHSLRLRPGCSVTLIKRGEIPSSDELEALMAARHTPGVHEKVRDATVGIAGVGGLGSHVAVALARTGVGKLILADFDIVEPSNLNRQCFFTDQIGVSKVEAMRANLERINPYITIETHRLKLDSKNCVEIFEGVDALVEAFDGAEGKAMLTTAFCCAFPATPLVGASGVAGYFPGNIVQVRRFAGNVWIVGDLEHAAAPGMGLMAPRVGIAAHQQANAVLRLLLGEDPVEG